MHPNVRLSRRTRRTRRSVTTVAALSIATIVLGGCASGGGDTPEGTTLTVYGWKGTDAEPANMEQVNAAFEAANPDINLEFEALPPNDPYVQRVQSELLGGDSADVIMTDASKVQTWGEAGYLADLGESAWLDGVLPEVDPFIRQDDTAYALPMEVIGISLYANADLLADAGVTEPPTTWPEFEAALKQVQDAGITPISLPNKGGWTAASALAAIAATKVYQDNPEWDSEFVDGDATFADWKSSVEQLLALQEDGFVDLETELGVDEWSQGVSDFSAGKSAFWFQGAWNIGAVEKAGVTPVFIPWPAGDDGQAPSANLFVGTMWSINEKSEVKDAAQKYLDFWADAENAAPFLEAENAVAPFTGATSPTTDATASFVSAFEEGQYHILPSNTWFSTEGERTLQQQTQALILGDLTVDEYLESLDALRPAS